MNEGGQRRVAVVVVGVTSHLGDGSAVTGRRATGDSVQAPVRIEELDLMKDPQRELEHLRKRKRLETGNHWRAGCSDELPAQF